MEIRRDLLNDNTIVINTVLIDSTNRPDRLTGVSATDLESATTVYFYNTSTPAWETASIKNSGEIGSTGMYSFELDTSNLTSINGIDPVAIDIQVSGADPQTIFIYNQSEADESLVEFSVDMTNTEKRNVTFPLIDSENPTRYATGISPISDDVIVVYRSSQFDSWESCIGSVDISVNEGVNVAINEVGSTGVYYLNIQSYDSIDLNYPILFKIHPAGVKLKTVVFRHTPEVKTKGDMVEINEQDLDGNNAILKLKQLNIQNDYGVGIYSKGQGDSVEPGHGVHFIGNQGNGMRAISNKGVKDTSGDYWGSGLYAVGADEAYDKDNSTTVSQAYNGIQGSGGVDGSGIGSEGGTNSGNGMTIYGTNQHGLELIAGAGDSLQLKGASGYSCVAYYDASDINAEYFNYSDSSITKASDYRASASDVNGADANIISVAGTSVSGTSDFKASGFATPTDVDNAETNINNNVDDAENNINSNINALNDFDPATEEVMANIIKVNDSTVNLDDFRGLSLTQEVDGTQVGSILQYIMAMSNGKFEVTQIDDTTNEYTFYKRDGSTVLFKVRADENGRTLI